MSIALFVIAVIFFALKELAAHGKFNDKPTGFWGVDSWKRKYAFNGDYVLVPNEGHKNWYQKLFRIRYKEKFFLSSTLLVMFTDSMHFFQFLFKVFLCLAMALHEPILIWWLEAVIAFVLFGIIFTLCYRILSK